MKKSLIVIAAVTGMLNLNADTIEKWSFEKSPVAGIRMDKKHVEYTPNAEKTPDGEPAGAFKVVASPNFGVSHGLQIGFATNKHFVKGNKYKVSFYAKASADCTIAMGCMQSRAPYKPVGPTVTRKISSNWKKLSLTLTADRDSKDATRAPNLLIGKVPVGTTLTFGPITLEDMETEK